MPDVDVVHGDACEPEVLEHARIGWPTSSIAVTGDDEDNLVVAMLSKHFGSGKVFARINHPKNEWLFTKDFGVDVPVSSTSMMLSLVEKEVGFGDLVTLLRLQADNVSIEEITLPDYATGGGQDARRDRAARELARHGDHHPETGLTVAKGDTRARAPVTSCCCSPTAAMSTRCARRSASRVPVAKREPEASRPADVVAQTTRANGRPSGRPSLLLGRARRLRTRRPGFGLRSRRSSGGTARR